MPQRVADFLAGHKKVTRVLYPFRPDHPQHNLAKAQMDGGGGVVAFEVTGGKTAAFKLANALRLIDISNNLGDAKSLLTHPETTTHPEADARGARRRRRHQRHAAPVGGAGRRRRSLRRPGPSLEGGVNGRTRIALNWDNGGKPFTYEAYPREHTIAFKDGQQVMTASASPAYKGDGKHGDPEDMLVAALSSCHMLSFLAICTKKRLTVQSYEDDAVGFLENDGGKLWITRVILRPKVVCRRRCGDPGTDPPPGARSLLHRQFRENRVTLNRANAVKLAALRPMSLRGTFDARRALTIARNCRLREPRPPRYLRHVSTGKLRLPTPGPPV